MFTSRQRQGIGSVPSDTLVRLVVVHGDMIAVTDNDCVALGIAVVTSGGGIPWHHNRQQTTNYTIVFPTHRHPTIHENIHDNESGILIRFLLRNPPHRDNGFMTRRHRIPVFMSFGVVIRSTSDRFVLDVSHRRRTKTSDELWRNSRKEQSSAEDKFGYRMSLLRWLKANRTERLENQTGGNLFIRLDLVTENILFGIRTRVGQHGRLERRELIKKSVSEGTNLEHVSATKRFNQRRLTSAAVYEHRFRFGDVPDSETDQCDVVEFSLNPDDDSGHLDPDSDDVTTKIGEVSEADDFPSALKLPEISHSYLTAQHRHENTGSRQDSGNDWTKHQLGGTLRRQHTEPDLCRGSFTNLDAGRRQEQRHLRPLSAQTVVRLGSRSPHLTQKRDQLDQCDTITTDLCQSHKTRTRTNTHEEIQDTSVGGKKQTGCKRSHKLPPVMKAHLKASTVSKKSSGIRQVARRQSLDSNMLHVGAKEDLLDQEQGQKAKHRLTPRSYFKKFGIPLERSELLEILLEERETLQQRIKDFLAKQNP
ncbi:hypothetical protein LSH36_696g01082 [Paralvinella palmiformis]|uniref:Uncharacterized protein n=1 Tax=Paralvinella palmiformis TaxID=53620 RepID=A0AAD9J390_9ANNE|nr:hypothetical protein LSH36_696g01082 [Paralvinella palmiformis]